MRTVCVRMNVCASNVHGTPPPRRFTPTCTISLRLHRAKNNCRRCFTNAQFCLLQEALVALALFASVHNPPSNRYAFRFYLGLLVVTRIPGCKCIAVLLCILLRFLPSWCLRRTSPAIKFPARVSLDLNANFKCLSIYRFIYVC